MSASRITLSLLVGWTMVACAHKPEPAPPVEAVAAEDWTLLSLTPQPARQTPDDLSGRWIAVYPGTEPEPGPIHRTDPCYGGIRFLVLQQKDDRVEARLYNQDPASGAERRSHTLLSEETEGTIRGRHLKLSGEHVVTTEYVDQPEISRDRQPVSYDLELDAKTLHLVGTRDGKPIRLAPLALEPLEGDCGDPPP